MEIYVANATLQNRQLSYRRREDMRPEAQPRVLEIPAAGQAQFPGDYDNEGVKWIIQQIERSGGVPHNDLEAIKRPHTLVYRVQTVVESDTISEAVEQDMNARTDVAAEQMENAGLAAYTIAERAGPVRETTLEITEVTDVKTVDGGVNMEITVSNKPGAAGKLTRSEPRRRKR